MGKMEVGSGLQANVIWSDQTHRIFETDPLSFHPNRPSSRVSFSGGPREVDAAFVAVLREAVA